MKLSFLCAKHRDWLLGDLRRAETYVQRWLDAGAGCETAELDGAALQQLGAAWELSYMIVDHGYPDAETAVFRLAYTARMLSAALSDAYAKESADIINITEAKLCLLLERGAERELLLAAFEMLGEYGLGAAPYLASHQPSEEHQRPVLH